MTHPDAEPPRIAAWILSHAVPADDVGASVIGDLSASALLLVTGFGVATALLGALVPVRSILRTDAAAVLRD